MPAAARPPLLWRRGALWLLLLGPFFFMGYGWLNHYTSGRSDVGEMAYAWERHVPFVPWLMLPYMSIDAFYAASLFMFRKRSALDRHALRLLLATAISLLGFWWFPLRFSMPVPQADGFNGVLQTLLLSMDQPYNQAPSLHISLLIILWVLYARRLAGYARWLLHGWFAAIAASVLLVYQHHFIDIWSGALVGLACLYLVPDQPFGWHWRRPDRRMVMLALRYLGAALLLLVAGVKLTTMPAGLVLHWLGGVCLWSAVALALVGMAYAGWGSQVFQRYRGEMRWPARLWLAPYLIGSWLSYRYHIRHRSLPDQVHERVWLGAFPVSTLRSLPIHWAGILDLTNEFTRPGLPCPASRYLPVLDLTASDVRVLVRAARWLDRIQQHGPVLLHCALGLSRSASVVVCWLVWRGHAATIPQAVAVVTRLRPGVVLRPAHLANIALAVDELRHGDFASTCPENPSVKAE